MRVGHRIRTGTEKQAVEGLGRSSSPPASDLATTGARALACRSLKTSLGRPLSLRSLSLLSPISPGDLPPAGGPGPCQRFASVRRAPKPALTHLSHASVDLGLGRS